MMPPPIAFTGAWVDRADGLRQDAAAQAALIAGEARLLVLDGIDPRLEGDRLTWLPLGDAEGELVFLGTDPDGHGCFAAAPPASAGSVAPAGPPLWAVMTALSPGDLAVYGIARSILGWHARHRFCPRCGGATAMTRAGWQRTCLTEDCRAEHFPRTDPVVIMTVEHPDGDALLLGRQPRFPAGRYTALAGFVEPGESVEEAVAREVFEEAGVRVGAVHYVASQPWPFPSSLMIGCHAVALGTEITIDGAELDDARWFSRAEVAKAMASRAAWDSPVAEDAPFSPPPHYAIAWHLLDRWVRG